MRGSEMSALADYSDREPSPRDQVEIYRIAVLMKDVALPDSFIADAVKVALLYEGVADLFKLWRDEKDEAEKKEIIADIQDMVDDCTQLGSVTVCKVHMHELDKIAQDVRAFKNALLKVVNEKSSITELARLTGIPQPSLSRFFGSDAMPRRTTLMKIATALDLDAIQIESKWINR